MNTQLVRKQGWMALLVVAALAACNTPDPELIDTTFPDRIAFTANRQYPEGIAYAPTLDKFLVSSLTRGKIGSVDRNGVYTDVISDDSLIAAVGIKVRNGLLYVCNGDLGVSEKSTTASAMKTAGLFVYDLSTGRPVRRVNLASLLPTANHYANDIAFDSQGNAYITDSFAPVIYRVPADANQAPTILKRDTLFTGQNFNLNGIVYHPSNFLIVGKANEGKLFKVDLANPSSNTAVSPITLSAPLPGCDGMLLLNNELYVVHERTKMARVTSSDGWKTATVARVDASGYEDATTNTEANGSIYALNARISEVSAAATAKNPSSLTASAYSIKKFQP
jgi:sugar lactone lactonase YvrE